MKLNCLYAQKRVPCLTILSTRKHAEIRSKKRSTFVLSEKLDIPGIPSKRSACAEGGACVRFIEANNFTKFQTSTPNHTPFICIRWIGPSSSSMKTNRDNFEKYLLKKQPKNWLHKQIIRFGLWWSLSNRRSIQYRL